MPRDVIMPALGMAQDTGLIVAWLKQAGDRVKTGDALMEVETDKAVMEVESPADGFLTDVRAEAGQNVPVGQVIAVINDTADTPAAQAGPSEPEATASAPGDKTPEGQSVIMPALGMAQDSGLIVAWHKAPGDAVSADDVLFEVETDKATMEVPAGQDGFVAALLAEAGQEVPVGAVVAIVSRGKPDAPITRRAGPAPAPKREQLAREEPAARVVAKPAPALSANPAQEPPPGERVLASPKARRLALEQGLDLSRLAEAGHPQPYHVKDLEALRAIPARAEPAPAQVQERRIAARVPTLGFADFLAWSRTEMPNDGPAPSHLMAAFASSSLRGARHSDRSVKVRLETLCEEAGLIVDADRYTASIQHGAEEDTPDLILRDLTGSSITSMNLGPAKAPVLGIARDGETYEITLDFVADQLSDQTAIALISDFADRLSDPTRQLL